MTKKRYKEILKEMKKLADDGDIEMAHLEADKLLVEVLNSLGHTELTEAYSSVKKWYA